VYEVTTDDESQPQVDALPPEALAAFAELRVMLETAPWNGQPVREGHPDRPVRVMWFGTDGMAVYLILEDQRRVDILRVIRAG
jgi:hypothetical protein